MAPRSAELGRLAAGEHHAPHDLLGWHDGELRVLRPLAATVTVVVDGAAVPATHRHAGVFVAEVAEQPADYRVVVDYGHGALEVDDPYRFWPTLGELDLHLISEGRHERLWEALGARPMSVDGVAGTAFTVWAPNARGVRVVGDFNDWDGRHPMRSLGASGVWELFVPGAQPGDRYKFEIVGRDGARRLKADPLARRSEPPPATASVIADAEGYSWSDDAWLAARNAGEPHHAAMSIYEVHLGSWRPGLDYRQAADQLADYVTECGFTHVELMPVMEHPFGGSWGYQVTGYFSPTARFGGPDDLRYLVDRLHRAGIGVILDWVPAHFPRDDFALAQFDGTALYEHADPRRGAHPEWGTLIFDFGRREVRNFLVASALYWLEEFHADGLRVDAVASMLYLDYSRQPGEWAPNEYGGNENTDAVNFLAELTATCYRRQPGVLMIAEESTAWPGVTSRTDAGGLGFGLKWNLGWMNDTLSYVAREPIHRQFHHNELTFGLMYAFSEQFLLPLSHDEVVHGKGSLLGRIPGDHWQRLATLRAYLAFTWAHPGKQLLFMGAEFGQPTEWSEERGLDWLTAADPAHEGVRRCVADLNRCYREHPALWALDHDPAGFVWCDADDAAGNLLAWLRFDGADGVLAAVVNFSPVPQESYRLGLPRAGAWTELLNTDAEHYGGSGVGNLGRVIADPVPHQGQPASATLRVPPLGAVWLSPE